MSDVQSYCAVPEFVATPVAATIHIASKKKAVLVASSSHTFTAAGTGQLTLRHTAAGRLLTRQTKQYGLPSSHDLQV